MGTSRRLIYHVIILSFVTCIASAQWTQTAGPEGVYANDFLVRGSSIFLATDYAGIFRSNDSGRTWATVNVSLGNRDVTSLTSHGTDMVAGTSMSIYRSTNDGASWFLIGTSPLYRAINDVASVGGNLYAATDVGVYKSTDSGGAGIPSTRTCPTAE